MFRAHRCRRRRRRRPTTASAINERIDFNRWPGTQSSMGMRFFLSFRIGIRVRNSFSIKSFST